MLKIRCCWCWRYWRYAPAVEEMLAMLKICCLCLKFFLRMFGRHATDVEHMLLRVGRYATDVADMDAAHKKKNEFLAHIYVMMLQVR